MVLPIGRSGAGVDDRVYSNLSAGGSGLTPDQLAKLNSIEVGAQKNPNFKTINGNEITET